MWLTRPMLLSTWFIISILHYFTFSINNDTKKSVSLNGTSWMVWFLFPLYSTSAINPQFAVKLLKCSPPWKKQMSSQISAQAHVQGSGATNECIVRIPSQLLHQKHPLTNALALVTMATAESQYYMEKRSSEEGFYAWPCVKNTLGQSVGLKRFIKFSRAQLHAVR